MTEDGEEEDNFDLSNLPPYYARKLNGFLREACKQGHLTCVDVLVSRGADVNYIDKHEKTTVLQTAIANGHIPITEYLFNKANEKTRQSAYKYTVEAHRKLAEALDIFKPFKDGNKEGKKGEKKENVEKAEEKVVTGEAKIELNHIREFEEASAPEQDLQIEMYREVDVLFTPPSETEDPSTPPLTLPSNGTSCSVNCEHKTKYDDLRKDYDGLQADYDDLQTRYDLHKRASEELISQLNVQIARLNNELKLEKEHNQETEGVLDTIGKEFSIKMKEIAVVKRNPLLDLPEHPKDASRKSPIDFSKGNNTSSTLTPSKTKKEGSQDDIEMHMEDRVKYRVKRLVRRWEEIADV